MDWRVEPADAGLRLDKYLADPDRLRSRARAAAALERGKVFVNGIEAALVDAGRLLRAGDDVRVWMDRPGSARARPRTGRHGGLDVVYEDDAIVVVNKPSGVLTVPLERNPGVPSVYDQIAERDRSRGKRRPFAVHRIDQDTSGLVVFAKDPATADRLKGQFKRREPERMYWAVVHGVPEPETGTWRDRLVWDEKALVQKPARGDEGKDAICSYRVVERLREAALLEVRLHTGRRNQIRIQAQLRGHPLIGETRYIDDAGARRAAAFGRHALHACRLAFVHPADGRALAFDAPPPPDLQELISRLRRA